MKTLLQPLSKLFLKGFYFTFFMSLLFVLNRIVFILYTGYYKQAIENATLSDIIKVVLDGGKYDNRVVAAMAIIFMIVGLFGLLNAKLQNKMLNFFACFCVAVILFFNIANVVYYGIYGNVFDEILLEVLFEDKLTLLSMGLSGEYPIISSFIIFIILSILISLTYLRLQKTLFIKPISWYSSLSCNQTKPLKTFILFILFSLTQMLYINAQFSFVGASLDFHLEPVRDPFLRKITPGAFRSFYLVVRNYRRSHNLKLSDFTKAPLIEVVQKYFNIQKAPPYNLYDLLTQTSHNTPNQKIEHVFYIISESLSSWHFDKKFDSLGLTSALQNLAKSEHGFLLPTFIESARRTVKSLDVQITGLPLINDNNLVNSGVILPSFPMAIGNQMKALGFKNNFYYAGSGIWNKLDSFTKKQGFDALYFNTHLLEYAKNKPYPKPIESNWGVHDNILFDYIIDNTNPNEKTFSMIMTLSNHVTRNVNLKAFNVPTEKIENFVKQTPKTENLPDANFLGHIYWYDKVVVDFIKKASQKFPNSLFIITGDHFDRSYEYAKNDLYITKSVPLILYAPTLKPKMISEVGSHLDIAPTIMELVAPKDFKFVSFGKPLFSNNISNPPNHPNYALGFEAIATSRYFYNPTFGFRYLNNSKILEEDKITAPKLYQQLEYLTALSWYLLYKQPLIPKKP
ncbi:LTA synthase family protein [Helicobacter cetorum]|uniref:LTA synthase family protein n=1 Tax=Helicobacter cetorum TaxID=138563 RepID=UPI000CF19C5B|nr:LTA synthase family protein [Helicobacter cetorum]